MTEKSFHHQGLDTTLQYKDPQFDDGIKKIHGFNFRVAMPERYSGFPQSSVSPPQTPKRNQPEQTLRSYHTTPPQDQMRRTPTTPVRHIEETYSSYKAVGWTPPAQDGPSSVAGSSAVQTCLLEEKPPAKALPSEYYKYIPEGLLSNQQRLTQAVIWSLRYPFDNEKPPTILSETAMSKEAKQGRIFAHQLKAKFMEELANGNIELQEVNSNAPNTPSKFDEINKKHEQKLKQLEQTRQLLKQEYQEWDKYQTKMNDRMAKFFEEKAMEKQTVSISDKEGIDGYREHLDEKQLKFYRDEIETVEPCDITLDGFEINEMPSLMRQSLNTVKAFNKQVSSFERDAINDLTLRVHKRSRLLPDDHEIPSVLDKKDASKVKEIETTENILHLLIQPSENKNQPE